MRFPRPLTVAVNNLNRLLDAVDLRLVRASTFASLTQQHKQLMAIEGYLLDLMQLSARQFNPESVTKLQIVTEHPVAYQSLDHISPGGAIEDNTRSPRFVAKCLKVFGRSVSHLDLGCAGGGLVWDFLIAGHQSYGVEGSDRPRVDQRAFWRVIPHNLCTGDITKPFYFVDEHGSQYHFDVITAWEVLEHLSRDSLPGLLENLQRNLDPKGLFVASVATFQNKYHVTLEAEQWWLEQFEQAGFGSVKGIFDPQDYVRGSGNPLVSVGDWDLERHPGMGFHLVVGKQ